MLKIAFDIDDTMIVPSVVTGTRDTPNYETIALYKWFQSQGNHMILWSGSGMDWARHWNEVLGLQADEIIPKEKVMVPVECSGMVYPEYEPYVDIAFDDCEVDLAKVNVRVKRFNNDISRKDWNETKRPFAN